MELLVLHHNLFLGEGDSVLGKRLNEMYEISWKNPTMKEGK